MRTAYLVAAIFGIGTLFACRVSAQSAAPESVRARDRSLDADDLRGLAWRSVGPANMGGRVAAVAFVPGNGRSFYVGFGTGGLWKTANRGVTFTPVFDATGVHSIGSVAVANAPANWKGWAAENEKEPVDAPAPSPPTDKKGKKGKKQGDEPTTSTKDTRTERGKGKIVWVGTGEGNGRNSSSWGSGVYRSTDGGSTFKSRGLEATHNIPRLAVDPRDPDVCYVAALGHLWGPNPERGIFKTTDGGATWQRSLTVDDRTGGCDVVVDPQNADIVFAAMYARQRTPWSFEGTGTTGGIFRSDNAGRSWKKLVQGLPPRTGRIGLAISPASPQIIYATVESDWGGTGRDPMEDHSPSGGLFQSLDHGETWTRLSDLSLRPFYFSRLALDPADPKRVYLPGWDLGISDDGGHTFRRSGSENVHVDFHAIAIDPGDANEIVVGNDGGVYISFDRAETWERCARMAVGQFYRVAVDDSDPYRIGGGLQDNGSWIGPSATLMQTMDDSKDGILDEDWKMVYFGDGFGFAFDPTDPNRVYATSQGGYLGRIRLDDMVRRLIRPTPREGQPRMRFNWNTPFVLSSHDPSVLYQGGNKLFKLTERGALWFAISPDLTRNEPDKTATVGSDAETYGTITTIAESPLKKGRIWVGTDDGRVQLTTDEGKTWTDVTPAAVAGQYVARIAASALVEQCAYVAVDGHRSDLYAPLVLGTQDDGHTWSDCSGDLPAGQSVKSITADAMQADLLYAGTEFGCYASLDRGHHWLRLNGKTLPPAPVDDIVVQPRSGDLVVATHGRSIWILDGGAAALRQLQPAIRSRALAVCEIPPARPRYLGGRAYGAGQGLFRAKNPPFGARIDYWVRDDAGAPVSIAIADSSGFVVRNLSATARRGMNRTVWDLQADPKHVYPSTDAREMDLTDFVAPGTYAVTVTVGEEKATQHVRVRAAPDPNR